MKSEFRHRTLDTSSLLRTRLEDNGADELKSIKPEGIPLRFFANVI